MAIDKIIIPTLGRLENQITYSNIPDKWKSKVTFVLQEKESNHEWFKDKNVMVVPNDIGIAKTRYLIADKHRGIKYAVFDDDLVFHYRPDITLHNKPEMTPEIFDEAFDLMDKNLDQEDVVASGFAATWSMYPEGEELECARPCGNVFYNGSKLPVDELDWLSFQVSEDYWLMMQLLSKGYKNKVSLKYFINCGATQTAGGCAAFRTVELHNQCFQKLKNKFPRYVKLHKKVINSGGFAGIVQLKAIISFRKLYDESKVKLASQNFFKKT